MQTLTYEQFGKLQFLDFFPRTEDYYVDKSGGMETAAGIGDYEGYGPPAGFVRTHKTGQTFAIDLDFANACPESGAQNLLEHLGFKLRKGTSQAEATKILGSPDHEDGPDWPCYVVGDKFKYSLNCAFHKKKGLFRISIYRKDFLDRESAMH
jgi:hypothetical protein